MLLTVEGALGLLGLVIALAIVLYLWVVVGPMRVELTDLRKKYNSLILEYWRAMGENEWLRRQLRARGIEIPPLPEELRPKMDAHGNISINVTTIGEQATVGQAASGTGNSQTQTPYA